MYVPSVPASLAASHMPSYPQPPSMFDLHPFAHPSPPPYPQHDGPSLYGLSMPPNYDFSYSPQPPSFPPTATATATGTAGSDYAAYGFHSHSASSSSALPSHSACSSSSSLLHPMPPADLISAFPSRQSSSSSSASFSPPRLPQYVDTEAAVSTVAALSLSPRSSTCPPYSPHHDRRSSAAVGTHIMDNQHAHRSTTQPGYHSANAQSGPMAVPITPSQSHPDTRLVKVKEELLLDDSERSMQLSPMMHHSALLRVNVHMANECYPPFGSASPDGSHSPMSLPSFTASSLSSNPSSPVPADIEAMDNAIDFQFAATGKPLRPVRHRKRRRKVTEINPLEVWRCPHKPCDKIYKRTSSVSINRHKDVCEYKPLTAAATSAAEGAGKPVKGAEAPAGNKNKNDVLQLVQQLLSSEQVGENGQSPISQLLSMATGGMSLEQLLAGALSEQIVKSISAQLASTPVAAAAVRAASASAAPATPAAGRKRSHHSTASSEMPALVRATSTPGMQATPHSAPSLYKRIVTPQREDTTMAVSPSTPSPTAALPFPSLSVHSPVSAPAVARLPHSTHHARSCSAALARHYPQPVKGSFLGNGGFLTGLVGTMGNELVKARAAVAAAKEDHKVDATAALSLKAAQVALAQRELVASLYGHHHQQQQAIALSNH